MKKNTMKNTLMTKKELIKHLRNLTTEYVENVKMAMNGYTYVNTLSNVDDFDNLTLTTLALVGGMDNSFMQKHLAKIK